MNSVDNLYEILRNLGLSEEYIEFIKLNIQDNNTAQVIIDEINKNKISDSAEFLKFIGRNFRLIPDLSRTAVNNTLILSKNIVESIISQNSQMESSQQNSADNENIVSVKACVSSEPVENDGDSEAVSEAEEPAEEQIVLTNSDVTQHTASLWKYQPLDENEPENHSEYISDKKKLSDAVIIGASVRGKKHKHDGSNRDDWFETDCIDDIAVIAVSDGAGSKKFSRIGAEVSCKASVEYIKKAIEKMKSDGSYQLNYDGISAEIGSDNFMKGCGVFAGIIQEAVISAYDAVKAAYEERRGKYQYLELLKRDMNFKDFSATLLLVLIIPVVCDGKNQHLIMSCQIGDGMIAMVNNRLSCKDAVKLLGEADGGAFAGETDFLTSETMHKKENLMGRTRIARSEISDVIIVTDGVADDYYPNAAQTSRLYTDLAMNGIVTFPEKHEGSIFSDIESRLPEPVSYPWVNDNSIEVPLNYSKTTAEACNIEVSALWGENQIATKMFSKLDSADKPVEERLKTWLDNYVERGSFDDRTLVIYSVGGNEKK